jgi:hypothetical protein
LLARSSGSVMRATAASGSDSSTDAAGAGFYDGAPGQRAKRFTAAALVGYAAYFACLSRKAVTSS